PFFSRNSTIRWAITCPIPGTAMSSSTEALLMSMLEAASCFASGPAGEAAAGTQLDSVATAIAAASRPNGLVRFIASSFLTVVAGSSPASRGCDETFRAAVAGRTPPCVRLRSPPRDPVNRGWDRVGGLAAPLGGASGEDHEESWLTEEGFP